MANYDELPVYKASYDLLLEIFRFTKEFTKEYKYTVVESLKKETLELITLIYHATVKYIHQVHYGKRQCPFLLANIFGYVR